MSLLVELSMWPMDKGESVSAHVARVLDVIDRSGVSYRLGPMGTCLEGEWDEIMPVLKKCFEALRQDSRRITFSLKADWRDGAQGRLGAKVESVEKKVGRPLKK